MAGRSGAGAVFALVGVGCVAAVAVAYVSQHRFGMQPCPWCVLQRAIFLAIALVCAIGVVWRSAAARRVVSGIGLVLAASGIAAALWQHFRAAASASCNLTLADQVVTGLGLDAAWPEMFSPRASCADAAVSLLGIPYDYWSLVAFVLAALGLILAARATRAPRRSF